MAILFPLDRFWFVSISFPSISPWLQILAGVALGAGLQMIYLQGLAYLTVVSCLCEIARFGECSS
jgi:hypothetical protein